MHISEWGVSVFHDDAQAEVNPTYVDVVERPFALHGWCLQPHLLYVFLDTYINTNILNAYMYVLDVHICSTWSPSVITLYNS